MLCKKCCWGMSDNIIDHPPPPPKKNHHHHQICLGLTLFFVKEFDWRCFSSPPQDYEYKAYIRSENISSDSDRHDLQKLSRNIKIGLLIYAHFQS